MGKLITPRQLARFSFWFSLHQKNGGYPQKRQTHTSGCGFASIQVVHYRFFKSAKYMAPSDPLGKDGSLPPCFIPWDSIPKSHLFHQLGFNLVNTHLVAFTLLVFLFFWGGVTVGRVWLLLLFLFSVSAPDSKRGARRSSAGSGGRIRTGTQPDRSKRSRETFGWEQRTDTLWRWETIL